MYLAPQDRAELASYLGQGLQAPVEVWVLGHFAGGPADPHVGADALELSAAAHEVMSEICELAPQLSLQTVRASDPRNRELGVVRWPALALTQGGEFRGMRFYGIPTGYEFAAFLDAVLDLSSGHTELEARTLERLEGLVASGARVHLEVFGTPNCPYCPVAAHLALQLAQACPAVEADSIDALAFPELADRYNIRAVPHVVINGRHHFVGAVDEGAFLDHIVAALAAQPTTEAEHAPGSERPEGPSSDLHASDPFGS